MFDPLLEKKISFDIITVVMHSILLVDTNETIYVS